MSGDGCHGNKNFIHIDKGMDKIEAEDRRGLNYL